MAFFAAIYVYIYKTAFTMTMTIDIVMVAFVATAAKIAKFCTGKVRHKIACKKKRASRFGGVQ